MPNSTPGANLGIEMVSPEENQHSNQTFISSTKFAADSNDPSYSILPGEVKKN